ncbi:MAG: hypothetical protein FJZ01_15055 [Candidatus Sericytochromatia bacterium]|nr:hypothetical protein [Candidatus Tanganyikabacteria bacterium]
MDDVVSRGLAAAKQLLGRAPWPAPEINEDDLPKPKKSRTGPLGKADAAVAEAPAWLRVYEAAPWVQTSEYRGRIDSEKIWPLYDLILTTPDMDRTEQVAGVLGETLGIDDSDARKFAVASVAGPLPILIGVPREAMETARRKLSGIARLDVIRSVWDRL